MPYQLDSLDAAIEYVRQYLEAMGLRKIEEAEQYLSQQVFFTFPGGRNPGSIRDIVAASGGRYGKVAKNIARWEGFEVQPGLWVVYCLGTLYGTWIDGTPFEGIRFIDRFEVGSDGILSQSVWNDTGEARLSLLGRR